MIELPYIQGNAPFPPVEQALREPEGLLAYGGDLSVNRLFAAYSQGIFPWFSDGEPLLWWSPNPRAIIQLDNFHRAKSLLKLARKNHYVATMNHAFADVIRHCAQVPRDGLSVSDTNQTWITKEMIQAYIQLHDIGLAHSVEIWRDEKLVGGLYGVAIGKVFCGESMFHLESNTSKLAMLALVNLMQQHECAFIDCQLPTDHLQSLGATRLERAEFIQHLKQHNATVDAQGYLLDNYTACWKSQRLSLQ